MNLWHNIQIKSNYEYDKTACGENWSWKRKLQDYDIWYVLSGNGQITINGKSYNVAAGTCCVLRPGDEVEAYHDPEDRFTLIYYHFSITNSRGEPLSDHLLPPRYNEVEEQKDQYWLEQYLHALLEYSEHVNSYSKEVMQQQLKLILTFLLHCQQQKQQPSHPHRHLMHKIELFIAQNVYRPIHHREIAQLVSLSPRYASRLFKEYSGYSIKEYIKLTRLNKARTMLMETNQNVTEIAEALGYTDIYFFSNQFKQHYGVSPMNYRKHMRKAKSVKQPIRRALHE